MWVSGFVQPDTGETFWYLTPTLNIAWFTLILAEFARATGLGANKQVVLVLDGASFHRSEKVQLPVGIQLVQLPAYAPELQPAEHLWSFTEQPVVNRVMQDMAHLADVVTQRCQVVRTLTDQSRAVTSFHWWPQGITSTA
ncbi:transposase [Candidatus Cyanaurora vandensis]|uniref:transposase n=1 Tax=Candidatus Cyanaurora vandensis TaxID=2714958 RepID=UPI0037BE8EA8